MQNELYFVFMVFRNSKHDFENKYTLTKTMFFLKNIMSATPYTKHHIIIITIYSNIIVTAFALTARIEPHTQHI